MLVLNRRPSESIHIGDQIIVTVLRVTSRSTLIGVEAPREVRIRRHELTLRRDAADSRSAVRRVAAASGEADSQSAASLQAAFDCAE
ncbi:MAG: carbon storage regulator [Planctomycetaceae bacterium]|nr:carbon storage regulator [Planctomycetaceae bacterium]